MEENEVKMEIETEVGNVIKDEKIRKVFLDDLPRRNGYNGKRIDWKNCIGYKVKFIYDEIEGEIKILDFKIKEQILSLKYKDKKFNMASSNFPKCKLGYILDKHTDEFKFKINQHLKDNRRHLIITNREYKKSNNGQNIKWYKYKCKQCGWDEGWIQENNLVQGIGCGCCNGKTVVEGINDIPTTAPWMVKYFQGGIEEAKLYTKRSHQKIYPVCTDCGKIREKPILISNIYKNHSIGCSCGDGMSYPEKLIYSLLSQLNIKFETEYSPEWCKYKIKNKFKKGRYDFYFKFNDKEYVVEMDGRFHNNDNKMNGQTAEESKVIDDYKDKLALEHSIQVIRIDCQESDLDYIKNNIINSELNNFLDLSSINWLECEEFALSNLVKIACDYKEKNTDISTKEIAEIMKVSSSTIVIYLKKGAKLGWSSYDYNEELNIRDKNNALKCKKLFSKKVVCIETNIIYDSITIASKETKTIGSNISQCCIGKRKTTGGYHWKFYNEYINDIA